MGFGTLSMDPGSDGRDDEAWGQDTGSHSVKILTGTSLYPDLFSKSLSECT